MQTSPDTTLCTLTKNGHRTAALMRLVKDLGVELVFTYDGELFVSQVYRDGRRLFDDAREKRQELEGKGWTVRQALT